MSDYTDSPQGQFDLGRAEEDFRLGEMGVRVAFDDWATLRGDYLGPWWPGCLQGPEDYYRERIEAAFYAGYAAGRNDEGAKP